jgi:hydroxypyruvate isomerase
MKQPATAAPEPALNIPVMLWTVFRKLPFEEWLQKVAEAGYRNVELVVEYQKWSEPEFASAIRSL